MVTDKDTGEAISGVTVILDNSRSTTTDNAGIYRFDGIDEGDHSLRYEKQGYVTWVEHVTVTEGALTVEVPLMKANAQESIIFTIPKEIIGIPKNYADDAFYGAELTYSVQT